MRHRSRACWTMQQGTFVGPRASSSPAPATRAQQREAQQAARRMRVPVQRCVHPASGAAAPGPAGWSPQLLPVVLIWGQPTSVPVAAAVRGFNGLITLPQSFCDCLTGWPGWQQRRRGPEGGGQRPHPARVQHRSGARWQSCTATLPCVCVSRPVVWQAQQLGSLLNGKGTVQPSLGRLPRNAPSSIEKMSSAGRRYCSSS